MVDTVVTVVGVGGDGVVAAPAVFGDGVVFASVGVVVDDWVPVGGAVVVVGDGVVIVVGVGVDGVAVGGAVAVVDGVIVVAGVVAIVLVSTAVAVEITLVDSESFCGAVCVVSLSLILSTLSLAFFAHGLLGSEHTVLPSLVWNLQQFIPITLIIINELK